MKGQQAGLKSCARKEVQPISRFSAPKFPIRKKRFGGGYARNSCHTTSSHVQPSVHLIREPRPIVAPSSYCPTTCNGPALCAVCPAGVYSLFLPPRRSLIGLSSYPSRTYIKCRVSLERCIMVWLVRERSLRSYVQPFAHISPSRLSHRRRRERRIVILTTLDFKLKDYINAVRYLRK